MVTAVIILIYITLNVACIGFYLSERRSEFNVLLHLVMPVLGGVAFIPAFRAGLGMGQSLISFVTPLPYPLNLAGPVVAGWLGLGLLYLIFLYASGRGDRAPALNPLYFREEGATFPSPRT